MNKLVQTGLKRLPLAIAVVAAFQIMPAFAHEQPVHNQSTTGQSTTDQSTNDQSSTNKKNQESSPEEDKVQEMKGMTVTSGSLLKRPEYQTVVPVQVLDIHAQQAAGAFSTANLLQSSAVAAGSTQINNQFSGFIVGGGTGIQTVNLRGLGATRTLVLLDGQRPGPAGVQGQTGTGFDLNVIPSVILQRVEIVKDGSSSIYGSDAVAGVVNMITKKRMDSFQFNFFQSVPEHGGGQQTSVSVGDGWNFSNGNITVAAQFQKQHALAVGNRSYFKCPQDYVFGKNGKRIDRADHSILQGGSLAGCNNLYADTIIDYYTGVRYNPTNGATVGPFPGYAPRPDPSTQYNDPNNPDGAYYTDVLNYPFYGKGTWALNQNRNSSLYLHSGFSFGTVNWDTQFLYNHRKTKTHGFRQFFPIVAGPEGLAGPGDNIYEPIMPYPSNSQVVVDYYYIHSKLSGLFMSTDSWSWEVNVNHSHDDGTYSHMGIDARKSGDLARTPAGYPIVTPPVNYFSPKYLSGRGMSDLVDAVGLYTQGHTTYNQTDFNAIFTGNLFELPAGPVTSAWGLEYRRYEINDQPDPNNMAGYEWGYASAQVTKGNDNVKEVFGEVGVPLLKGIPGIESLVLDLSGREFKYKSVGDRDNVWKIGLNWQITDHWRIRGTMGTSYRAPQLYELYLGNQSGFLGQIQVDPCINWGESTNSNIRTNCAAVGIPPSYDGNGASAETFRGGGKGFLKPETSRAKSVGIVWTPDFGNFNMALDYFDYHIRGEIDTLSAGAIVTACYNKPVYPNHFCDLFHRNGPDAAEPFMITDIHATFININSERTRGYDFQFNYSDDFSFGHLRADAQITYTLEDSQQLFSSAAESGFTSTDFVGQVGRPATVGLADVTLKHGHWIYTWQGNYVSTTHIQNADRVINYFGYPDAELDLKAGWQFRHSVSVGYQSNKWKATFGIRNLFDKQPDVVSTGFISTVGNVPISASQYDWFGRTYFVRFNYKM